jgi:hypothetical protein
MSIKTVDANEWIKRLGADTDGSVHREWLRHEESLLRIRDGSIASQECTWDGTRSEVWTAFDKTKLPTSYTTPWPKEKLFADGSWLLDLGDKNMKFEGAFTYAWIHALRHGTLENILDSVSLRGAPQNMPPPWVLASTIKRLIENPELADSYTIPLTSLMAVLRHNTRAKPNGKILHEMLIQEPESPILKAIIDFYEDHDTDLGMVSDMHTEFSKFFPLSGYILLRGDHEIGEDAADMIDKWPAEIQMAIMACESLGLPTSVAVQRAWKEYRAGGSNVIAVPLPVLMSTEM